MFDSVGWGEILVLVVAGLFILGPERLPDAAAWVGRTVRQVKGYASGAREQLRGELGPELDELRQPLDELRRLRGLDPRRAVTRSLFEIEPDTKPNGYPAGSAGGVQQRPSAAEQAHPLPDGRPPIDSDAT